jgi:hypothetical protein
MDEKRTVVYTPSDGEKEIINRVWTNFSSAKLMRQQTYRHFNDRSFETYVNDSMDRWNGYMEPRTDPAADWGAKVFDPMTRNKTVGIIAQVTAERTKAEFFAQNTEDLNDKQAARICKNFDDHAAYKNRDIVQQFMIALEASTKGTCVDYESYRMDKRTIKEITDYDPTTGEVKYDEKEVTDWNDVYSDIIPLFDIYFGNVYERDVQKQPYIVWRSVLNRSDLEKEFGSFRNFDKIQGGGDTTSDDMYKNWISDDIDDEEYEVIRYFDRWEDEMDIVVNGVLITPLISPFPWNHKKYPFAITVFERFDSSFIYGKSLPDKLKADQDTINVLWRMMLDQQYLSINKPIFTTSQDALKDTFIFPGRKVFVDSLDSAREFNISPPDASSFNMIKLIKDSMDRTSIDDATQGVSGSNSTAFEVSVAKESAAKLLALFLFSLEDGMWQKINLRLKNQFQFYQMAEVKSLLSENEYNFYNELRRIVIPKTTLADGTTGTQVISVVPDQASFPSQKVLDIRENKLAEQGQNTAFTYVTVDWLNNLDVLVHIIPNSSIKMSEALTRALEVDFQTNVGKMYSDIANREEMFKEFAEVYGKDPQKLMNGQQAQPVNPDGSPIEPGGVQPNDRQAPVAGMAGGQGMQQGGANANSMLNAARGVVREGTQNA